MAIKYKDKWKCSYCGTVYADQYKADACRDKHELIYVPISKSDLNKLLNFIYIKDDKLLTESLMNVLTKYLRGNR